MRFFVHAFLLGLVLPAVALGQSPEELVARMSREVLDAVRADKDLAAGNRQKGVALAEQKILPYIDFEEATRLAAGRAWALATAAQKEKLVREFRAMLVRTYSNASAGLQADALRVLPVRGAPSDEATVRTQLLRAGAPPLAMEFRARQTERGWKIYDIVVDGVSLVLTYRSEFDAVVKQSGVEGLIRCLGDKNAAG